MKPAAFSLALVFTAIAVVFMLHEAPLEVVVAAAMPAMAYAALVVTLLRPEEPPALLVALFLWGAAVAAPAAEHVNALFGATALGPAIWAPLVEETLKALGLVLLVALRPERLSDARSGIACGALVGLGFAAAENIPYLLIAVVQGGASGLSRAVFVRGVVQGLNHATFTGRGWRWPWTRAPLAERREDRYRSSARLPPRLRAAWRLERCSIVHDHRPPLRNDDPPGSCQSTPPAKALYFQVPLLVALFIGPGLATLAWLAREGMVATSSRTSSGR